MVQQIPGLIRWTLVATTLGIALMLPCRAQSSGEEKFQGRGLATGSVFGVGRNVTASLTFHRGNFTFSLAVPPPKGAQKVTYRGTYPRLQKVGTDSRDFILEGQIQTFTGSHNTQMQINTSGTCRIEVVDSQVRSSRCRTAKRVNSTEFNGA
jgi:hypothetical protein